MAAIERLLPGLDPESVAVRLFNYPYTFNFFQAVRVLERLFPDTVPVGFDGPVGRETVRFCGHVSLNFPPGQIWDLRPPAGDQATAAGDRPAPQMPVPQMTVPQMIVPFFGMVGPSGVMPRHYTELLLRIQRDVKHGEKFALRDWFDLFTHRMLSLFYRAWEKYRFYISYERGEYLQHPPDPFTHALLSLSGLGLATLRSRIRVVAPAAEAAPAARPKLPAPGPAAKIEQRPERRSGRSPNAARWPRSRTWRDCAMPGCGCAGREPPPDWRRYCPIISSCRWMCSSFTANGSSSIRAINRSWTQIARIADWASIW